MKVTVSSLLNSALGGDESVCTESVISIGQQFLVLVGTESVKGDQFLTLLGQYRACMPLDIEKSGDLVG